MEKPTVYLGADIAKDSIEFQAPGLAFPASLPNIAAGHRSLIRALQRIKAPVHVVLEATGSYQRKFTEALHKAGVTLSVLNPRQPRDFARARGQLAKTDANDARILAEYGAAFKPKPTPPPDPTSLALADLCTRRAQLVRQRTAENNRLQQAHHKTVIASHKTALRFIDRELASLDKHITATTKKSPALASKVRILSQTKGIGATSAAALLAALPEIGTLSKNQATALAGLAPFNRDSGTFRGKRSIHGGRRSVRQALYMATFVATRFNPIIKAFYLNLRSNGKPHQLALTASMRKLLVHLNSSLKHSS